MAGADKWSRWLLRDRFGNDPEAAVADMRGLAEVRDRVLANAKVAAGERLLDIGAGDGLVAFAALDRVGEAGTVLFTDISRPLLLHSRGLPPAVESGGRVRFLQCAAEAVALADESVDVVTTRSVLIYVQDKAAAFREFFRVLKPGGRLSSFEPINAYRLYDDSGEADQPDAPEDVRPLIEKLAAYYSTLGPESGPDPMMDFDERDLVLLAGKAGFAPVKLQLEVNAFRAPGVPWDVYISRAPNPNLASLDKIMEELFTAEERGRYEAYLRPRIEAGGRRDVATAGAWVSAVKPPATAS